MYLVELSGGHWGVVLVLELKLTANLTAHCEIASGPVTHDLRARKWFVEKKSILQLYLTTIFVGILHVYCKCRVSFMAHCL